MTAKNSNPGKMPGASLSAKIRPADGGGYSLECFLDFTGEAAWAAGRVPIHTNRGPIPGKTEARAEAMRYAEQEGFKTYEIDFE